MITKKNILNTLISRKSPMNKNVKLLISSVMIVLTFLTSPTIHGTEDCSTPGEQKPPPGMQLSKGTDDSLEAVLGTGNNVLLKMSMSLKSFREPIKQEHLKVPVQFFLTDFMSCPTSHSPVALEVKIDCESTTPTVILSDKPESFESYNQFSDWLNQGYFTNETKIAYDFHINVHQSAPSLAQELCAVAPGAYHFVGTYVVHNAKMAFDSCVPTISYCSQRGKMNVTTITLGGILYLNKKPYPVTDHQQIFPHQMIEEKVFKKDETKKFYNYQWLAQSEITAKVTYEEFPNNLIMGWPDAPTGRYSIVQQKPGDKEDIEHLSCFDGSTGEEINVIEDEKIFLICETIREKQNECLESIVQDVAGKYYITMYRHYSTSNLKREGEEAFEKLKPQEGFKEQEEENQRTAKKEAKKQAAEETKKYIEDLKRQLEENRKSTEAEIKKQIENLKAQLLESIGMTEEEVKQQRSQALEETGLRGQQGIFVIRSSRIDECISIYKEISKVDRFTYRQLRGILAKQIKMHLYSAREFYASGLTIPPSVYQQHIQAEYIQEGLHYQFNNDHVLDTSVHECHQERFKELLAYLKKDVLESMEFYNATKGEPHPRWEEFSKLSG